MANMNQTEKGGYVPTVIDMSVETRFANSLRFHARFDVRSKDAFSAFLMNALTQEPKRLTPKEKIALINKLNGA